MQYNFYHMVFSLHHSVFLTQYKLVLKHENKLLHLSFRKGIIVFGGILGILDLNSILNEFIATAFEINMAFEVVLVFCTRF